MRRARIARGRSTASSRPSAGPAPCARSRRRRRSFRATRRSASRSRRSSSRCAPSARVIVKDRPTRWSRRSSRRWPTKSPALARAAVAARWNGGDDRNRRRAFLGEAESSSRSAATPRYARSARGCRRIAAFVPFAHRASCRLRERGEALTGEPAALAAGRTRCDRFLLYDGEGCLSLHGLVVERGGDVAPDVFARSFGAAVRRDGDRVSRRRAAHRTRRGGRLATATLAAFARQRPAAASSRPAERATIVVDPPRDDGCRRSRRRDRSSFRSTAPPIPRVRARHALPLQAVGETARAPTTSRRWPIIGSGAVRDHHARAAAGSAARAHHGGRPRIADFVRWIDDVTNA